MRQISNKRIYSVLVKSNATNHIDQEVTSEFRAAVIGYLMDYKIPLGNIKEYIKSYSFKELMNCLGCSPKRLSTL